MNKVEQFYNTRSQGEWERFDRHPVEFAITKRLLARELSIPCRIIDIGGGPGRYSLHLAALGHQVTLVDLAQANVDFALGKAAEFGVQLAGAYRANAVDLSFFPSKIADAVLLMGPLYHLLDAQDRESAIREAVRLLRPGGKLFATMMPVYGPLVGISTKTPEWAYENPAEVERLLTRHNEVCNGSFIDFNVFPPQDIPPLMKQFGLQTIGLYAQEGLLAGGRDRAIVNLPHEGFEYWMDLNFRICGDPTIVGSTEHVMYIGKKQLT